jgi:branched-chain amino acid transport system substrate-binding protein
MANFVFNELKLKKVATLTDTNSSYSKELTASFSKTFLKLGGKIVARGLYEEGEEDYSQLLQGMKNSKPQAIYIPGYYTEIKDIARQSAELNIETIFLGGDGWDSPSIFEGSTETLENAYLTDHFSVNTPNEKVKTFVANYKKLFNLEPDSFAALGYDSLYILADSLKRAGTSESLKLRDAVAQTRDFAGVTGKLSLNAYRDARKEIIMVKISKQNFTYHSIIPPK